MGMHKLEPHQFFKFSVAVAHGKMKFEPKKQDSMPWPHTRIIRVVGSRHGQGQPGGVRGFLQGVQARVIYVDNRIDNRR